MRKLKYDDMPEVMTPEQAGKYLALSAQAVRVQMYRGALDIGVVLAPAKHGGRKQYRIFKQKLLRVLGKEEKEECICN